jgi:hypothetical protein
MSQARVLFFGVSVLVLLGVVVQFFLAGLNIFGGVSIESHRVLGFGLMGGALLLVILAFVGRLPRRTTLIALVLLVMTILQTVLVNIDVDEIQALHPVNALFIGAVASALMERSRDYLASKMAA